MPNGACRPVNPLDAVVDDAVIRAALAELTAGGDGHGGFTEPPAGALIYRPNAETAALVRARDRHCRFPGCQMPSARCQLDHIVPFDHEQPDAGGWTIISNIQCLCAFHHQLKTHRLWAALALPGGAIRWISSYGVTHHTFPRGAIP